MKKIMFNDRFLLTNAVIEGTKTMARRFINGNYSSIIISEGKHIGVVGDGKEYVRILQ